MAGSNISIDAGGANAIADVITQLIQQGQQLKPALSQIGEYLVEATQERFQLEVAPDGSLWEPLAPETIRRKNGDTRILRQRSTLVDTILYDASDEQLLVGSNMEYAATHQFGREDDGIPAREWLGLTTGPWNDEEAITDILYDHFNQDLPNR
ncbi:phage virion morphogenesis protein [Rheinheimera aquimaris]|uniref:phage virion morphogenesis protein n=1 Tax=Rheinheimera aquimaris TaxID=412437 RepID=UPI001E4A7BA5|nr:phage virion morphogenesis protein [Rheinheimera aquimaris]MCD1597870.1 phage virion morphogenesis protein [Rheinheimera aquimaris]